MTGRDAAPLVGMSKVELQLVAAIEPWKPIWTRQPNMRTCGHRLCRFVLERTARRTRVSCKPKACVWSLARCLSYNARQASQCLSDPRHSCCFMSSLVTVPVISSRRSARVDLPETSRSQEHVSLGFESCCQSAMVDVRDDGEVADTVFR